MIFNEVLYTIERLTILEKILTIGGLYLAASFIIFIVKMESPRTIAIRQWAHDNGWMFSAKKQKRLQRRFPEFSCLDRGKSQYAENFVHGKWGDHPFETFDYSYLIDRDRHVISVVTLEPELPLVPLVVRRERKSDRIARFFGFNDIDFESSEFSRLFHVSSPNRKWAYNVLHARAIEDILQGARHEFQFSSRKFMMWSDQAMKLQEIEKTLDLMARIIDGIPDFARSEALPYAAGFNTETRTTGPVKGPHETYPG